MEPQQYVVNFRMFGHGDVEEQSYVMVTCLNVYFVSIQQNVIEVAIAPSMLVDIF